MKDANIFLQQILEKIRKRIIEINASLAAGEKDVEEMHEYYWENYTEMDEYGYENFDNQQALLTRINANQEQLKLKARFKKMLNSPYFGRVDFCYDGDDEPETFYIGIGNFSERKGALPLIFDWRAPVSSLFYDYDSGPACYMAPGGEMTGEVTGKWQYKIRRGKLLYAFESDMKIDDEILGRELGGKGDVKLKNIIQTIQKEQNAIIRNTTDRIMVIQGVAGSGKTSVALHRIAYLLYHDRERLKSSNVLILSPNGVFSDYISHILPELGEENIREMSFDMFAYRELKPWAGDCEDRYHLMEQMLCGEEDPGQYREKQTKQFIEQMRGYVIGLEDELMNFKPVKIRKWEKSAEEIQELFYYKFTEFPMMSRMDAVQEYVVDEYETLAGCELEEDDLAEIHMQFENQFETTDLYRIYSGFLEAEGYEPLPDVSGERRMVPYADVYPMLYMKYLLWSRREHGQIKHLIIDEMQDYSYLQYRILELLFSCRMTILGDKAQTMDDHMQDVTKFLPKIFGKDIRIIEMNKSYRNTMEIASYANALSGGCEMELFERHGAEVEEKRFADRHAALCMVAERLLKSEEEMETAAVLTFTEMEAQEAWAVLKKLLEEKGYDTENRLTLLDRDSSRFRPGLTVTTFYLAKGLEFEQVFFVGEHDKQGALFTQARYIAATRALHSLHVYEN